MKTPFSNLKLGAKFFAPSMGAVLLEKVGEVTARHVHNGPQHPDILMHNPDVMVDCLTVLLVEEFTRAHMSLPRYEAEILTQAVNKLTDWSNHIDQMIQRLPLRPHTVAMLHDASSALKDAAKLILGASQEHC